MDLFHEKKYEFQTKNGSKVEIEIEAKIEEVSKNDLEDILRETAMYTHNFYLSLGRKIAGID